MRLKKILQESFVPALALLVALGAWLAALNYFADDPEPLQIRISADDVASPEEALVLDKPGVDEDAAPAPQLGRDAESSSVSGHDAGSDAAAKLRAAEERVDSSEAAELLAIQRGERAAIPDVLQRAWHHVEKDSLRHALIEVDRVLKRNPYHGSAWFARGLVLSRLERVDLAIEAYRKSARHSGGRAKAVPLYNLGCLYRDNGWVEDAVAVFQAAIERRPNYAEARLNLATLLRRTPEKRGEAFRTYDQLIRLHPDYAQPYYNRGLLHLAEGDTLKAIADFDATVERDAAFVKAWFNLGLIHGRAGHIERAIHHYQQALVANPEHLRSRVNLAASLARLGRYEEAAAENRAALVHQPTYARAWYNLGLALAKLGDAEAAEQAYVQVLELDREHADAWLNLGVLQATSGRRDDAKRSYAEALAIDPAHQSARYNLALAFSRDNKLDAAIEEAARLCRLAPDHAKARKLLRSSLQDKLERDPGNKEALALLHETEEELIENE